MHLEMCDGRIERAEPGEICTYVDVPAKDWLKNLPYT